MRAKHYSQLGCGKKDSNLVLDFGYSPLGPGQKAYHLDLTWVLEAHYLLQQTTICTKIWKEEQQKLWFIWSFCFFFISARNRKG